MGALLAAALLLGGGAGSGALLRAQGLPDRPAPGVHYMGVMVGARAGFDYLFNGIVLGGQLLVMPEPWGRLVLMPSAEYEFRQGLRDWQANGDVAVMVTRGIYVGGGVAYRNTIFDEVIGRETRRGHSVILGLRELPSPGRTNIQVELRWSVISFMRPRMITVGMNYPLMLLRGR